MYINILSMLTNMLEVLDGSRTLPFKDSTPDRVRELQEAFGLNDYQIQLMSTDGPCDEFLHNCIRVYFQSLIEPAKQARRFVRTSSTTHTSYTEIFSNQFPSPLKEIQGEEKVNEQLDDTYERELIGSASI